MSDVNKKKLIILNLNSRYVRKLTEIFLEHPEYVKIICEEYALTEEELFNLLKLGDTKSVPVLDEITQSVTKLDKEKQYVKKRQ